MLGALTKGLLALGTVALLAACSNGGEVTIEPSARKFLVKGTPFAQVNEGGRALIVERGKTAKTGISGWVAIQSVAATQTTDARGNKMVINKTAAFH